MAYQITLMILPLVTMPYVSRVLGAEGIGTYSYTYSIAQYFLLFGMLGVENYGNRSIARIRDNTTERSNLFSSIYSLQFMIALISVFAYLLYIKFCKENCLYALIQVFYVLSGAFDINWLFFGMEEFKITVTRKILLKLCTVLSIFIFVKNKNDLWKYIFILSFGYFTAQSSMWLFAHKYVRFHFVKIRDTFIHLKGIVILFIPIIATSIYRMMDKVMIGLFNSMTQVGFYENSDKLINVCLCVISAFGAVMMPKMSNLYAKKQTTECSVLFVRSMEIAMFIGSAISFGIASIAPEFIPIFYGNGYEECIAITIMLSSTVPFITWACIVRTLFLIPAEKNSIYIKSVFAGATINCIINLILIPKYAATGAAVGTIIAEITVAIYQTLKVKSEIDIKKCIKKTIPFIVFGFLMFFTVRLLPFEVDDNLPKLLLKIMIGAVLYLALSTLYFIKTKNAIVEEFFYRIHKAHQ